MIQNLINQELEGYSSMPKSERECFDDQIELLETGEDAINTLACVISNPHLLNSFLIVKDTHIQNRFFLILCYYYYQYRKCIDDLWPHHTLVHRLLDFLYSCYR